MRCRMVELQIWRSDILDPLIEERSQIETRDRLETRSDVVEGCHTKAVVAVEPLQCLDELRVANLVAQHVERHGGLAIADRFRRGIVAAPKARQREVVLGHDVVRDPLQDSAAMFGTLAALFSNQVVGQISGQTLAPVPARKVNEYTVRSEERRVG